MYLFILPIYQISGDKFNFEVKEFIFNSDGKITDVVIECSNKDVKFEIKF